MDKALLVGINKYPGSPLRGCINDISDMANYLVGSCNFPKEQIRLLADERATKAAIIERLNWLTTDLNSGDRIFFHYSGHGAQVATRNISGEVDGLDEIICPVDFDWTDLHMIRDKEFNVIFKSIPNNVQFIWVSDSCHSADLFRDFTQFLTPKVYPTPVDISWRNSIMIDTYNSSFSKTATEALHVALLSGCKSNQTSADAVINGRPNGAMTYFLLDALKNGGKDKSLIDLIAMVNASLCKSGYAQQPQVEGDPAFLQSNFY